MNNTLLITRQQFLERNFTSNFDITNLSNCIEDVREAALNKEMGPANPRNYHTLLNLLEESQAKLPPLYQNAVYRPFVNELQKMGQAEFNYLIKYYPNAEILIFDIAHAIIQNGQGYYERATDAFQEVVSDLYDGYLSNADRWGIKPPDLSVIPPLVKWGNPSFGPYTWPVSATSVLGLKTAIVSLPPANAKHGLLAWSAIPHEAAGHDILHADLGLLAELEDTIRQALKESGIGSGLPDYWASRMDETASDVIGILNMGPAAGIGLIGYFRGLNLAFIGKPVLRNIGPKKDVHPADILRGYLAAATVRLLKFEGAKEWGDLIEHETSKDLSTIILEDRIVDVREVRKSAKIVAEIIAYSKMKSLEYHGLGEIQNWYDSDESIVRNLGPLLTSTSPLPNRYEPEIYATHVVAAAIMSALSRGANLPLIFDRMQGILKVMHNLNPSWGPLFVRYPGDITPHVIYQNYVMLD